MRITIRSALAIIMFFIFFPLESRAEAALSTKAEARCARIEKMLFAVQLNLLSLDEKDYDYLDKSLKASYKRLCESELVLSARDGGGDLDAAYPTGVPIFTQDGGTLLPSGKVLSAEAMMLSAGGGSPPIVGPFQSAHERCAPGCSYTSWGIWGDERHQAKRSCHNSGQAIDIHAISCNGRTYAALSGRFDSYVECMRDYLGVIYRRPEGDHDDHAHFELHGCEMCQGQNCGSGKFNGSDGDGDDDDSKGDGFSKKKPQDNGDDDDDDDGGR